MKQMGNWEKKLTMQVMAALLASAAMGTTAFAAEAENSNAADTAVDVYELEDTVVTAERRPTKKMETPANTTVITAREIEDNHYQSVDEAIGHVNGVSIVRMGGGEIQYVRINGDDRVVRLGIRLVCRGLTARETADHPDPRKHREGNKPKFLPLCCALNSGRFVKRSRN